MKQHQAKKLDIENKLTTLTLIQKKLFLLTLLERLFYTYQKHTKGTYYKTLEHWIENYWDYVINGTKHPCILLEESDYAKSYNDTSQKENGILLKLVEEMHYIFPSLIENDEIFLMGFGTAFQIIAYFIHNYCKEEQKSYNKNCQSCLDYLKNFSKFVIEHELYQLEYTREKKVIEYLQKETDLKKIYQQYHIKQKESLFHNLFPENTFSFTEQKNKTPENFYANWVKNAEIIYDKCEEIILKPEHAEIYYYYIKEYIYKLQNKYEKAIQAAENYVYWKRYALAIQELTEAIQENPDLARAYYKRACVYEQLKEYQKAIDDFTKAIALSPDFFLAYYRRACSYNNLGKDNKAIADFTKAITLKPDFAQAYCHRSHSYYHLGEYQKAIADCEKAEKINPGLSEIYYNCGNSYYQLGEYQKAILNYEAALAQNSRETYSNKEAYLYRKKIIYLIKKSIKQKNKRDQSVKKP